MDAEPGRCRRTDGKKWRCRLAVLTDKKYCERHIHRGRLRSRKPVEVNKTISKPNTMTSISSLKATPNLEVSAKTSAGNYNKVGIKNQSFKIKKHSSRENARVSLELTFSPKSVLQSGNGCGTSHNGHNSAHAVAESERCKRTDGKKWRCSKGSLPGQKYCVQHMHRGAKKVNKSQKSNTGLSFSVGVSYDELGDDGNRSNDSSSSSDDNGSDPNVVTISSSSEATTISM